jgi:hypothetical protein
MTDDQLERDPGIAEMLRAHYVSAQAESPQWAALHHAVMTQARPELAALRGKSGVPAFSAPVPGDGAGALRRTGIMRRLAMVAPALLAACVAFLLVTRSPGWDGEVTPGTPVLPALLSVDDIMNADISDEELRAALLGASDAVALLLLAASEPEDG